MAARVVFLTGAPGMLISCGVVDLGSSEGGKSGGSAAEAPRNSTDDTGSFPEPSLDVMPVSCDSLLGQAQSRLNPGVCMDDVGGFIALDAFECAGGEIVWQYTEHLGATKGGVFSDPSPSIDGCQLLGDG